MTAQQENDKEDVVIRSLIFLMEFVSVKITNDDQYDKAIDLLNELKEQL
jgi:hypothetical protein